VLWGTLLSGAAGVEWYFGANNRYNDLNAEDWRSRDRLWELTKHAMDFFQTHLPYWEMQASYDIVNVKGAYCLQKSGELFAIYLPDSKEHTINLEATKNTFEVKWFDPLKGGALNSGTVKSVVGGSVVQIGLPPSDEQDWVVLLQQKK
jgi:hypothetical protein